MASQSEYFKLSLGSMKESKDISQAVLTDVSFATLQLLIQYAYCGSNILTKISLQVQCELHVYCYMYVASCSEQINNSSTSCTIAFVHVQCVCMCLVSDNVMSLF